MQCFHSHIIIIAFFFLYQILSNKDDFSRKRELYICLVQNLFCFSPDKGRDALPSTLNLQFRPDRVGFPFTDRIRFLSLFFLSKLSAHISLGCNSLAIPSTNFPACSLLFLKGRLGWGIAEDARQRAKEPRFNYPHNFSYVSTSKVRLQLSQFLDSLPNFMVLTTEQMEHLRGFSPNPPKLLN